MKAEKRDRLKKRLLAIRQEVAHVMKTIKDNENESTPKEASGDLSSYSFHLADQGTDSMDHLRNFIHAERDSGILRDIDDALLKIESGEYGKCESCEQPISQARLDAIPYARLCVECQVKEEGQARTSEADWEAIFPVQEEEES